VLWRERGIPQRLHVDLGAREARTIPLVMLLPTSTERFVLTYRAAGLAEQRHEVPFAGRNDVAAVVLADPPRMRGQLFSMVAASGSSSSARPLSLAEVAFSPESGDPLVPDQAAGWAPYPIVFATVSDAERLEGAARRAFVGHVQAGARVVLVPRRPEDCASPIVRELMGAVRCDPWVDGDSPSSPAVADGSASPASPAWVGVLRMRAQGDALTLEEPFGVSRPLGFGTVFLLGWDANAADASVPATEQVMRAVVLHLARQVRPHHALGSVPNDVAALRTALDPNESFRPALGGVAILLLLYVFAVGPINFHLVAKRGRPTLALLTTPLIALACLLLLASGAYLSKGVWMRYRSIDVLELASGEVRGVRTRYLGYYLTRPHTFDVTPRDGVRVSLLEGGGGRGPVALPRAGGLSLADVRGGLWETVVTQEQSLADTQEAVRVVVQHDNAALVTVVNHGTLPLRGAVYVSQVGEAFALGDIPPGESRAQPVDPTANLPEWELRMPRGSSPDVERVARELGFADDAALALRGAMSIMREGATREGVWARLEGEGDGASAPGFALDWERRLVFIAANREAAVATFLPEPEPEPEPERTGAPPVVRPLDPLDPFGVAEDATEETP
jgi:hypothetical protein